MPRLRSQQRPLLPVSGLFGGQNRRFNTYRSATGCCSAVSCIGSKADDFRPKRNRNDLLTACLAKNRLLCCRVHLVQEKPKPYNWRFLAHIAAHRANSRCRVLMVAPTHKAIQEFVAKLATMLARIHKPRRQRPQRPQNVPRPKQ